MSHPFQQHHHHQQHQHPEAQQFPPQISAADSAQQWLVSGYNTPYFGHSHPAGVGALNNITESSHPQLYYGFGQTSALYPPSSSSSMEFDSAASYAERESSSANIGVNTKSSSSSSGAGGHKKRGRSQPKQKSKQKQKQKQKQQQQQQKQQLRSAASTNSSTHKGTPNSSSSLSPTDTPTTTTFTRDDEPSQSSIQLPIQALPHSHEQMSSASSSQEQSSQSATQSQVDQPQQQQQQQPKPKSPSQSDRPLESETQPPHSSSSSRSESTAQQLQLQQQLQSVTQAPLPPPSQLPPPLSQSFFRSAAVSMTYPSSSTFFPYSYSTTNGNFSKPIIVNFDSDDETDNPTKSHPASVATEKFLNNIASMLPPSQLQPNTTENGTGSALTKLQELERLKRLLAEKEQQALQAKKSKSQVSPTGSDAPPSVSQNTSESGSALPPAALSPPSSCDIKSNSDESMPPITRPPAALRQPASQQTIQMLREAALRSLKKNTNALPPPSASESIAPSAASSQLPPKSEVAPPMTVVASETVQPFVEPIPQETVVMSTPHIEQHLRDEIEALRRNLASNTSEIRNLKSQLNARDRDFFQTRNTLNRSEKECASLRVTVADLNERLSAKSKLLQDKSLLLMRSNHELIHLKKTFETYRMGVESRTQPTPIQPSQPRQAPPQGTVADVSFRDSPDSSAAAAAARKDTARSAPEHEPHTASSGPHAAASKPSDESDQPADLLELLNKKRQLLMALAAAHSKSADSSHPTMPQPISSSPQPLQSLVSVPQMQTPQPQSQQQPQQPEPEPHQISDMRPLVTQPEPIVSPVTLLQSTEPSPIDHSEHAEPIVASPIQHEQQIDDTLRPAQPQTAELATPEIAVPDRSIQESVPSLGDFVSLESSDTPKRKRKLDHTAKSKQKKQRLKKTPIEVEAATQNETGQKKSGETEEVEQEQEAEAPLLCFNPLLLSIRSFRLSPLFPKSLLNHPSFSNRLKPSELLCRFELLGRCNDDECPYQHLQGSTLTPAELFEDIVSYAPPSADRESLIRDALRQLEEKQEGDISNIVEQTAARLAKRVRTLIESDAGAQVSFAADVARTREPSFLSKVKSCSSKRRKQDPTDSDPTPSVL